MHLLAVESSPSITQSRRPMTKPALLSLLVALSTAGTQAPRATAIAQAPTNTYALTFSRETPRVVKVEATFRLIDSTLRMMAYGMEHLPDGWRTFVSDERFSDSAGHPISFRRAEQRQWILAAPAGATVRASYTVRIGHDQSPTRWFPGAREAAYVRDGGVFALGRALFIVPGMAAPGASVRIVAPAGWSVALSLPPVEGAPGVYHAESRREMTDALLFVGEFEPLRVTQGVLQFDYAIARSFDTSRPLFDRATRAALSSFRDIFLRDPAKRKYLVVVNTEPEQTDGFGGAFPSGFSMTFPFVPNESSLPLWGFTLTHEVFHLWNGYTMVRGSPAEEWFLEGGADYYTNVALARSGQITRSQALQSMSIAFGMYGRAAGRASLADAGNDEARSGDLLYKGGWAALTAVDLDIRARTSGARSLDDALRILIDKHSRGAPGYRNADILAAVNSVAGADYAEFFAKYVSGREVLNLDPYLRRVGLTVAGGRVTQRNDATAAELLLQEGWLGASSALKR